MSNAADKTHVSLEPMFSILNPSLPGFRPLEEDDDCDRYELSSDGSYVKTPSKSELREQEMTKSGGIWNKMLCLFSNEVDEQKAKGEILRRTFESALSVNTHFCACTYLHITQNYYVSVEGRLLL